MPGGEVGQIKRVLLIGAALAGLVFVAGASGTTAPGHTVTVQVLIQNTGLHVQGWIEYDGGTDLAPLPGSGHILPRGDFARFVVVNHGTKIRNFQAFGKNTGPIKPGKKKGFNVLLVRRGTYAYKTTLNAKGPAWSGFLVVGSVSPGNL